MARRNSRERRRVRRHVIEAPTSSSDVSSIAKRESTSPYDSQLVTPPASSGPFLPSSPSEGQAYGYNAAVHSEEDGPANRFLRRGENADTNPIRNLALLSELGTTRSRSPSRSETVSLPTVEPGTSGGSKRLSLKEKTKLLKISYRYGPEFLRCQASGEGTEKEVWTSIMEEFSATVRAGVFTNHSQVKKQTNKICKNRRKKTRGTTPPERRPHKHNLDMWIDRWVRVWKCCDMMTSIANAHQSIRETIGEKRLKRVFRDRMDGAELPEELGVLTFSAPLWKAIQKRIHTVEQSSERRSQTVLPSEDESGWTDEDMEEVAAPEEMVQVEPLLQSVEEESENSTRPAPPEDLGLATDQEVPSDQELRGPSPRTWQKLQRFEQGCLATLKEAKRTGDGGQISILGLAAQKQPSREQQQTSPPSSFGTPGAHNDNATEARRERESNPEPPVPAKHANDVEDTGESHSTSSRVKNSVPTPTQARACNVGTEQQGVPSLTRAQRLLPDTYTTGEAVFVGWDTRQIHLPKVNALTEQDFRQAVFATFSANGCINFRLRKCNMRGELVPSEFRLKGITAISSRDIMYTPQFHGLPYNQIRLEVGRQSLVSARSRLWTMADRIANRTTGAVFTPISQRGMPLGGVGTVPSAASTGIMPSMERAGQSNEVASEYRDPSSVASTKGERARDREGVETTSHAAATANKRGDSTSKIAGKRPFTVPTNNAVSGRPQLVKQKSTSVRSGTPPILREYLAEEARKRELQSAPVRIPHVDLPARKPSPEPKKPSLKHRITPSRFYGINTRASARNDKKRELEMLQTSPRLIISPRQDAGAARTAGLASRAISPKLHSSAIATTIEQSDSDSESLPDVEELYRRHAAKFPASQSASKQPSGGEHNRGDTNAKAMDEGRGPRAISQVGHSGTTKSGESNADLQKLPIHQDRARTLSNSRSKKRARRQSTLDLSSSSLARPSIDFPRDAILSQPQNTPSTANDRSVKRRKESPHPGHVVGAGLGPETCASVDESVSELQSRSRRTLSLPAKVTSDQKHKRSSEGVADRDRSECVPSRIQDECPDLTSMPLGGDSNVPKAAGLSAPSASSTTPPQQLDTSKKGQLPRPRTQQYRERRGHRRGPLPKKRYEWRQRKANKQIPRQSLNKKCDVLWRYLRNPQG